MPAADLVLASQKHYSRLKEKTLRMARTMIMGVSWLQCNKSLSKIGLFTFKTIQLKDVIIEVY